MGTVLLLGGSLVGAVALCVWLARRSRARAEAERLAEREEWRKRYPVRVYAGTHRPPAGDSVPAVVVPPSSRPLAPYAPRARGEDEYAAELRRRQAMNRDDDASPVLDALVQVALASVPDNDNAPSGCADTGTSSFDGGGGEAGGGGASGEW